MLGGRPLQTALVTPVGGVSQHGMPHVGQVNPDLMRSPRPQLHVEKRRSHQPFDHSVHRLGGSPAVPHRTALAVGRMTIEREIDLALGVARDAPA